MRLRAIWLGLAMAVSGCDGERGATAEAAVEKPATAEVPPISSRSVRLAAPRVLGGAVARWPAETLTTPGHEAEVSPPIAGVVRAVRVAPGDRVEAGAAVVLLRSPERATAHATERAARRTLDLLRRRLALVTRQERQGLALAEARFALERAVLEHEAEQHRARALLLATTGPACSDALPADAAAGELWLCAPQAGVVAKLGVRIGASVDPAGAPLVTFVGTATGRVALRRIGPRPSGVSLWWETADVTLRLDPRPVGGWFDAASGATVEVHLPAAVTELEAGMRGTVVARLAADAGAFAVPRTAVAQRNGRLVVARAAGQGEPDWVAVSVLGGDNAETWVRAAPGATLRAEDAILAVAPGLGGGEE